MIAAIVILSALSITVTIASIFLFKALKKSFKSLDAYEKIYNDVADDIQAILEFTDALRKREYLAEDPDILKFYKITEYMHNVLLQYTNDMGDLRGLDNISGEKDRELLRSGDRDSDNRVSS